MGTLDKWFVFGRDAGFDEGLRSFESAAYADAAVNFEAFLSSGPLDPSLIRLAKVYLADSFNRLGDQALSEGQHDDACDHFGRAVLLQPSYADLQFKLARALAANGDSAGALEHLDSALKLNSGFVAALMLKAILLYQQENCDQAMSCLMDAIQEQPNLENERFEQFVILHNGGKNEEAVKLLWEMLEAEGSLVGALIQQAAATATAGDYESAAEQYVRILTVAPKYADIHCRYGECLLELGHLSAAESQFRGALAINSRYVDAIASLGVTLRRQGDEVGAKAQFGKALDLAPNHPVATAELARLRV